MTMRLGIDGYTADPVSKATALASAVSWAERAEEAPDLEHVTAYSHLATAWAAIAGVTT